MALILVIDDDDSTRGMLRRLMERDGHEVVDAPNGKLGLRLYQERRADVVITDILMPEKEGIATILDLRKLFPDAKIIAISGQGRQGRLDYLDVAEELGAVASFVKPIDTRRLRETVRGLVDGAAS
jgi:DNA-binding NtrC family response regulator